MEWGGSTAGRVLAIHTAENGIDSLSTIRNDLLKQNWKQTPSIVGVIHKQKKMKGMYNYNLQCIIHTFR